MTVRKLLGEGQSVNTGGGQISMDFLEDAFHMYYDGLCRYAGTLLEDGEGAKDIVQQVFVTLWERRDTLTIASSVKSYLYRAVYNACINRRLRGHKHQSLETDVSAPLPVDPEFLVEVRELRNTIEAAIASLPPQCQVVFRKSREEEKSYPVIAKELGISIKAVEAQVSKALKSLKVLLGSYVHK